MKLSELRQAVVDEFGSGYGAVITTDLALPTLGGRTVNEAVSAGDDPRAIWFALCAELGVDEKRVRGAGRPEPKRAT